MRYCNFYEILRSKLGITDIKRSFRGTNMFLKYIYDCGKIVLIIYYLYVGILAQIYCEIWKATWALGRLEYKFSAWNIRE